MIFQPRQTLDGSLGMWVEVGFIHYEPVSVQLPFTPIICTSLNQRRLAVIEIKMLHQIVGMTHYMNTFEMKKCAMGVGLHPTWKNC